MSTNTSAPPSDPRAAIAADLEKHRRELAGHCSRMLGSVSEVDDAVQETMVRAWRGIDGFEGRSAVRTWLYRIATNVCIDMLRRPQRRALAMDLGPCPTEDSSTGTTLSPYSGAQSVPASRGQPAGDPAELAESRESVRLAFVTALQHLPSRQRAVLILREVLRWPAAEVAELLDTTVASVNSALQRARATLAERDVGASESGPADASQRALLARYIDAFERYEIEALVDLLREDAVMSMHGVAQPVPGLDRNPSSSSRRCGCL